MHITDTIDYAILLQGELVANVADIKSSTTALVEPLREKLKAPRIIGDIGEKDLANREITVMADKSLPYEILKKVMATCTDADYGDESDHCGNDCGGIYANDGTGHRDEPEECVHCECCCTCTSCEYARVG